MMIGQLKPNYVYILNQYLRAVEQRNSVLKKIKLGDYTEEMIDIWDDRLLEYGDKIYQYRKLFIEKINNIINEYHQKITEGKEFIKIEYKSDLENKEDYIKKIKDNRNNDIFRGITSRGTHRDDLLFYINDELVSTYGSQGQHRTVILSLKLSELSVIKEEIEENPILLLDDFMSELDSKRRNNFLKYIEDTQVIITCTDKINNDNINKLYYVEDGTIKNT